MRGASSGLRVPRSTQGNEHWTRWREELGFDPDELGGSAWVAGGTSLVLFALGALVPLLPFPLVEGLVALIAAACLSALTLVRGWNGGSLVAG
jgi:vacuolar iron transporter family protein